jgi:SAM-dependent methyltransferase
MNTILNDAQRELHKESIDELSALCPATIARKIPRANVQQAFVLSQVKKLGTTQSEMLCVGSFEDTACESLEKLGFNIIAIDPCLNDSLESFFQKNTKKFDVIFSTSVIEHVENDELFIDQICKLLKPEGYGVLTCDFNNDYTIGSGKPIEDFRLYTKNDLLVRLNDILKRNDCELYGDADYDHAPDFQYGPYTYTFATYVFKKK